jgi:hypothetical protein
VNRRQPSSGAQISDAKIMKRFLTSLAAFSLSGDKIHLLRGRVRANRGISELKRLGHCKSIIAVHAK